MTLAERLEELVRAAFSGIWVQSFEHDDAVREIADLARRRRWTLATWDIDRGFGRVQTVWLQLSRDRKPLKRHDKAQTAGVEPCPAVGSGGHYSLWGPERRCSGDLS